MFFESESNLLSNQGNALVFGKRVQTFPMELQMEK